MPLCMEFFQKLVIQIVRRRRDFLEKVEFVTSEDFVIVAMSIVLERRKVNLGGYDEMIGSDEIDALRLQERDTRD